MAQEQAKSLLEAQRSSQEAEAIISKAKSAMELERQTVLNDARQEIASLVVLATSKVLERELNDDERKRFTEQAENYVEQR